MNASINAVSPLATCLCRVYLIVTKRTQCSLMHGFDWSSRCGEQDDHRKVHLDRCSWIAPTVNTDLSKLPTTIAGLTCSVVCVAYCTVPRLLERFMHTVSSLRWKMMQVSDFSSPLSWHFLWMCTCTKLMTGHLFALDFVLLCQVV